MRHGSVDYLAQGVYKALSTTAAASGNDIVTPIGELPEAASTGGLERRNPRPTRVGALTGTRLRGATINLNGGTMSGTVFQRAGVCRKRMTPEVLDDSASNSNERDNNGATTTESLRCRGVYKNYDFGLLVWHYLHIAGIIVNIAIKACCH